MSAAILTGILIQAGAPILKSILEAKVGGVAGQMGGAVIDAIAGKLNVSHTADSIVEAHKADPVAVESAIREVENEADWLAYLAQAGSERNQMLAREDEKSFFEYGWRPAMSWLVIFLFMWALVLVPLINAAFRASVAPPSIDAIVQFAGLWLVIYGGGHTAKYIWGKK